MDKPGKLSDDQDDFNYAQWKATKKRIEAASQLPEKITENVLQNGKKTVKYQEDPHMDNLIRTILRESDKLPDEVSQDRS